jgi:hypothetical protein
MSERARLMEQVYLELSRMAVDATPCPCLTQAPPDPLLDENLTVWDDEPTGARYWDEKTRTLHIVQTEPTDTVRIEYTGPNQPAKLDVYVNDHYLETLDGGGSWSHAITYIPSKDPYEGWREAFFPLTGINTYGAQVCTYEYRCPEFTVTVKVYNPDQWELKLRVPPLGKQSMGRRLSRTSKGDRIDHRYAKTQSTDPVTGAQTSTSRSSETVTGQNHVSTRQSSTASATDADTGTSVSVSQSRSVSAAALKDVVFVSAQQGYAVSIQKDARPPVEKALDYVTLERNTARLDLDVLKFIGIAIELTQKIHKLKSAIKNGVPEVGWYWDVNVSILEGELACGWGWQEETGPGVYYSCGLGAKLTLLSVNGSLGAGIDSLIATAQAVVELSGEITAEVEPMEMRIGGSESSETRELGEVGGSITLDAYAEVVAGDMVSIKAGARSTFLDAEMKAKWSRSDNYYIDGELEFEGVTLYYQAKTWYGQIEEKSVDLMGERTLGRFRFPKGDDPGPEDIDSYEALCDKVEDAFETSIFSGNDIKVYSVGSEWVREITLGSLVVREGHHKQTQDEIDNDMVISHLTQTIWAERDRLDMSHSTVEGLLYAMKEDILSEYGDEVDVRDFTGYLQSGDFQARIEAAESPTKRLRADIAGGTA